MCGGLEGRVGKVDKHQAALYVEVTNTRNRVSGYLFTEPL